MNNTVTSIGALQARLNALVATTNLYTEDLAELYTISTELDQLIVAYYNEYQQ
ncbi:MAG: Spo0E family sporulation regulatory protein-aspartic acid phosphatase [Cellulosilyticaceae bacterium]